MEVDIPQPVNSYRSSPPSNGHHVQFDTEVKVVKLPSPQTQQSQQQRPKHKSRRRARVPNLDLAVDEAVGPSLKPLSPSKLKKMADKDRHSRTGRRGHPKKGEQSLNNCNLF